MFRDSDLIPDGPLKRAAQVAEGMRDAMKKGASDARVTMVRSVLPGFAVEYAFEVLAVSEAQHKALQHSRSEHRDTPPSATNCELETCCCATGHAIRVFGDFITDFVGQKTPGTLTPVGS